MYYSYITILSLMLIVTAFSVMTDRIFCRFSLIICKCSQKLEGRTGTFLRHYRDRNSKINLGITMIILSYLIHFISVALVRNRTIPTERLPHVGEASANFCG
jgi:hypothetical protein